MLRRTYLAILIIIIGLNASLEAMPKDVVVSLGFDPHSASPVNPGPYGTSELVELLKEKGYRVSVISSLGDLAYVPALRRSSRVIVSIIAPDRIDRDELNSLLALAAQANTSFLIASENIEGFTAYISYNITETKCGLPVTIGYPLGSTLYNATSSAALIIGMPGRRPGVVATGYVSEVRLLGIPTPEIARLPPLRVNEGVYLIALAALPAGYALSLGHNLSNYRFPAGVACDKGRGKVVVLGDSTIFTNMALSSSKDYQSIVEEIFSYLAGNETRDSLVVFLADVYNGNTSVAMKFHPSMVLTTLALHYKTLEDEAMGFIGARPYIASILIGLMAVLVYSVMPTGMWRRASRELGRLPAISQPSRFLGSKSPRGLERLDLTMLCAAADTILRRRLGLSLAAIEVSPETVSTIRDRELRRTIMQLSSVCSRGRPGIWERLLGALGLVEDRRKKALELLSELWRRYGSL
jgi:hypothetical protein